MGPRMTRAAIAVACMALVLAACGGDGDGGGASATPTVSTIARGTLTVGSDIPYEPFEFEQGGDYTGFDIELVRAVAEKLGLTVEIRDVIFDTIFTSLAAGQFDVVASAVTAYAPEGSDAAKTVAERREIVAFTIAYYDSLQSLAVNTARSPNIKSTNDLKSGDRVAVQRGTTGQTWALQNLRPKGIVIVDFPEAPPMFQALQAGQVVGILNDLPVSLEAVKDRAQLQVVEQIETGEQYAFALNKNNPELLEAFNGALRELFEDGTYARLFKKYFPDQKLPAYAEE